MKLKTVTAYLAGFIISIGVLHLSLGGVSAAENNFVCDFDLKVSVAEDYKASFNQQLNFSNEGEKVTISEFTLKMPYAVEDVLVRAGRRTEDKRPKLGFNYNNNELQVAFGDHFIKGGAIKSYTLEYSVPALAKIDQLGRKTVTLPAQSYCNGPNSTVEVNIPASWGRPDYLSNGNYFEAEHKITFSGGDEELFVAWGSWAQAVLNLEWELKINSSIPIPSSYFNDLSFQTLPVSANVYRDGMHNEFLDIAGPQGSSGGFQASIITHNTPKILPVKSFEYLEGPAGWLTGLDYSLGLAEKYQWLIAKFSPALVKNSTASLSQEALGTDAEKDSLQYALAWATILETTGKKAFIVHGPVSIPNTKEVIWGYWVGYQYDGIWLMDDPYLEDLVGINNYNKLAPGHYPWGIITPENLYLVNSVANLKNLNSMIVEAKGEALVLGDASDVTTELVITEAFLNKLSLKLVNNGGNIVYLDKIKLDETDLSETALGSMGVLPFSTREIDLSRYLPWTELVSNAGRVETVLELFSNGRNISLAPQAIHMPYYWIYPVFIILLFIFGILLSYLLKLGVGGFLSRVEYNKQVQPESNEPAQIYAGNHYRHYKEV